MIMDVKTKFQSGQIISLDDHNKHLYVEVIEEVISRGLCWVRPLLLVEYNNDLENINNIIDLQDAADLLWPINSFRMALDTEVINLLGKIIPKEPKFEIDLIAQKQLNLFIHQLWQSYQQGREI